MRDKGGPEMGGIKASLTRYMTVTQDPELRRSCTWFNALLSLSWILNDFEQESPYFLFVLWPLSYVADPGRDWFSREQSLRHMCYHLIEECPPEGELGGKEEWHRERRGGLKKKKLYVDLKNSIVWYMDFWRCTGVGAPNPCIVQTLTVIIFVKHSKFQLISQ